MHRRWICSVAAGWLLISGTVMSQWVEAGPAILDVRLPDPLPIPLLVFMTDVSTVGWSFKTKSDLRVTHLGLFAWNGSGLGFPHAVGIWDSDGALLVSTILESGEGNPLVSQYRYNEIAPVVLPGGHTFTIGATVGFPLGLGLDLNDPMKIDGFPFSARPTSIEYDSEITVIAPSLLSGRKDVLPAPPGILELPTEVVAGIDFGCVPNFQFVPEPGVGLLGVAGAVICAIRRRRA